MTTIITSRMTPPTAIPMIAALLRPLLGDESVGHWLYVKHSFSVMGSCFSPDLCQIPSFIVYS